MQSQTTPRHICYPMFQAKCLLWWRSLLHAHASMQMECITTKNEDFTIRTTDVEACNFFEIRLRHRCFPENFLELLRTF